jgi:hypothetical protein
LRQLLFIKNTSGINMWLVDDFFNRRHGMIITRLPSILWGFPGFDSITTLDVVIEYMLEA